MKRILFVLLSISLCVTLFAAERIEGPFLILSTPYNADGSVNYDNLVREARFASSWKTSGIIWPQSNDANDLLTREERFQGMEALVKEWKQHPSKTVLTLGVNGDDTQQMLVFAREAERLASVYGVDIALCARPFGRFVARAGRKGDDMIRRLSRRTAARTLDGEDVHPRNAGAFRPFDHEPRIIPRPGHD